MSRPKSSHDLIPLEKRFVTAMSDLGFGRLEFLRIQRGELVLDPWPTTIRDIKLGTGDVPARDPRPTEFDLKSEVAEFFEYVRAVDSGEIRCLVVKHGLPFTMEVEHCNPGGGHRD